ncbi:hypothetical protein [Paenibacillus cymbidii]|uniref:hypothetical protein n=1 Tax=Paenibacillus cymbidii TaxID=1639034 RepID=UPI00107FFECC|nr:hypothetical protein [Paenibacillus cymbidii]
MAAIPGSRRKSEGEIEYEKLLERQKRTATGARLEQLNKQAEGERKLLTEIIWPVRHSFEGIVLEKEFITLTGVKAYIDAYEEIFHFGFEGEGYVSHAENITRPRFDFEKMRIRSMGALGILYVPFTFDEMDKKPDLCQRTLYELYGKFGGGFASPRNPPVLTPYEKEVIRYSLWLARPIRLSDACECLLLGKDASRNVMKSLVEKGLLRPTSQGLQRTHVYELTNQAFLYGRGAYKSSAAATTAAGIIKPE